MCFNGPSFCPGPVRGAAHKPWKLALPAYQFDRPMWIKRLSGLKMGDLAAGVLFDADLTINYRFLTRLHKGVRGGNNMSRRNGQWRGSKRDPSVSKLG